MGYQLWWTNASSSQVYEFILDYILFVILWRRSYKKKFEGELFVIYLIAFAIIRGIVEFFRINPVIWGPFSISHLLSLALIIIGIVLYKILSKKNAKEGNIYAEENKFKLTTSIIILILLIGLSTFIFYFVQR